MTRKVNLKHKFKLTYKTGPLKQFDHTYWKMETWSETSLLKLKVTDLKLELKAK